MQENQTLGEHLRLPKEYVPPSYHDIVKGIKKTGLQIKGESVPWAVATAPMVLPENLGEELTQLGKTLVKAFQTTKSLLKSTWGGDHTLREKVEGFVAGNVPSRIPTQPEALSRKDRTVSVMRPDIVVSSEKIDPGKWKLSLGIAEVETRPAGTFILPALLEGYGLDSDPYTTAWEDKFHGRSWAAIYPKEWSGYTGELHAFGDHLKGRGGEFFGLYCLEDMTSSDVSSLTEKRGNVYLFGYVDVWERAGCLTKAQEIVQIPGVVTYNPLDYHLETKSTLILFKQPWFLEEVAKRYGDETAQQLNRWTLEGYVLTTRADQDLNLKKILDSRNEWILKVAGFSREATESKGIITPKDSHHETRFEQAIQLAFAADVPWILQRYMKSEVYQQYYDFETGEKKGFSGAMRLSPLYLTKKEGVQFLGAISTTTYGSVKAHGGSGKELKPGMSVLAPVVFDNTPNLIYEPKK